jgi:hypothetical protein
MQGAWHERLKAEVPRADIPAYLGELQRLVAALRRYRDDLRVPTPEAVRPLLTPLLVAHGALTVAYITDARYAEVVRAALAS